ncbi:MAG: CBS domain-containing protein [Cyanobacteria bacterium P01_B01_bin.77]
MASQPPLTVAPSIMSALNRQVLKVSPDTSIADVIRCMSNGAESSRASCAIVVDRSKVVLGIITERDIVGLAAKQSESTQLLTEIAVSTMMTTPVKTLEVDAFQDIFAVLFLFRRYRIRHLPIVDAANQLMGVVTPASIRKVLKPANLLKLRRVADVMTTDVVQAPADVSVIFLAQLMAEHRVSCVVIVDTMAIDDDGEPFICPPIGIVTERDIVQFKALDLDLQPLTAREVMSAPLFLLDPQDSLWAAHESMQEHKVRRLVVSWNWGKDIGIVTQTSLLRVFDPIEMFSIINSLQQTVNQTKAKAAENSEREAISATQSEARLEQDSSFQVLLSQAVDCIEKAAKQPQISLSQESLLQQAVRLIQQICP